MKIPGTGSEIFEGEGGVVSRRIHSWLKEGMLVE